MKIQHYKFWHENSTLQVQHTEVNVKILVTSKKKFNLIRLTCKFNIKIQHKLKWPTFTKGKYSNRLWSETCIRKLRKFLIKFQHEKVQHNEHYWKTTWKSSKLKRRIQHQKLHMKLQYNKFYMQWGVHHDVMETGRPH